jgi:hypothetical protein
MTRSRRFSAASASTLPFAQLIWSQRLSVPAGQVHPALQRHRRHRQPWQQLEPAGKPIEVEIVTLDKPIAAQDATEP